MRAAALGAIGSAAALTHFGPAISPLAPPVGEALGIVHRQPGGRGVVLTFDDGPHPQGTPLVLEILREAGAPATFFLVGEQVVRRPDLAAEIVAAGHRVELHCHRHQNLLRISRRAFLEDVDRAQATIEDATGQAISVYRPPYGIFSGTALRATRRRGLLPVLWSKWGKDWSRHATAHSIAARVTTGVEEGDIILLHDADFYSAPGSWQRTANGLRSILTKLGEMGFPAVQIET